MSLLTEKYRQVIFAAMKLIKKVEISRFRSIKSATIDEPGHSCVLAGSNMKIVEKGYVLRPEIIESAYYLYHFTKDPRYLDMGQTFFNGIVKYCKTDVAYAALSDVEEKTKTDRMESFFLAETLKYLYLLFDPEALDFDKVIFNTEAHPLQM